MNLEKKDKEIFQAIEKLRSEIIAEAKAFDFIDYGAGDPDANLDHESMYRGVKKTRSTAEMCKIGLKNNWAEFLYLLVKEHKPKQILELGTCCGFSSIYMAKANPEATIYTIEGCEDLAKIAQSNMQKLQCSNIISIVGRFQDVLKENLEQIKEIDLAFIDGHHDHDATLHYYKQIKPYLSTHAIVIFDDINWSDGMKKAWNTISTDPDFQKVEDLGKLAVCYM
jgi:predicted O-methyltransferase YrrM